MSNRMAPRFSNEELPKVGACGSRGYGMHIGPVLSLNAVTGLLKTCMWSMSMSGCEAPWGARSCACSIRPNWCPVGGEEVCDG